MVCIWKIIFDNNWIFPIQMNEHRKLSEIMAPVITQNCFPHSHCPESKHQLNRIVWFVWQLRSVHPTKWNNPNVEFNCVCCFAFKQEKTARSVGCCSTTVLFFVLVFTCRTMNMRNPFCVWFDFISFAFYRNAITTHNTVITFNGINWCTFRIHLNHIGPFRVFGARLHIIFLFFLLLYFVFIRAAFVLSIFRSECWISFLMIGI